MKIALYTCNIGNYRDEFKNYYNAVLDQNIDYFLFTDQKLTNIEINKLHNWTICKVDVLPSDNIMGSNRWTSKYIKFILPEILKSYDIIVWNDSKNYNAENISIMGSVTYQDIMKVLTKYPNAYIINLQNQFRKTPQEELKETIKLKYENKEPGHVFLNYIKNFVSSFCLVDTCFIIRKNNIKVNETYENCFNALKEYNLKRDQNIYNYVLDQNKLTPVVLDIYDIIDKPICIKNIQTVKHNFHNIFTRK